MTGSEPGGPGRIFISYRREDAAYPAGWLFDRLAGHFGHDRLFKDVDSIELGDDFVEVINAAVGSCAVLLAVIGPRWLAMTDEDGQRRLDNSEDFVRLEIEAALERQVRVIPVLVEGARMPPSAQLPESLRKLARRQALELAHSRFNADCDRLIKVLDKTLAGAASAPVAPAGVSAGRQPDDDASQAVPPPAKESAEPHRRIQQGILEALYARALEADEKTPGRMDALTQDARESSGELVAKLEFLKWDQTQLHEDETGPRERPPFRLVRQLMTGRGLVAGDLQPSPIRALDPQKHTLDVAFSPNGVLLAAAGADGTVRLWQVATGALAGQLERHAGPVRGVAFRPDGGLLATAGPDAGVRLWNCATWTTKRTLASSSGVNAMAFSPDGGQLVTGGPDGFVSFWEVATGRLGRAPLARPRGRPVTLDLTTSVAFSPDGALVASGGSSYAVRLVDVATRQVVRTLEGHTDWVHSVVFQPGGKLVASGGDDGTVRLWNVATGRLETTLADHDGAVNRVAFSPDGVLLASAGADKTVRFHDLATGASAGVLTGHAGAVYSLAFSPDGSRLATAGQDSIVGLWGR